DLAIPWNMLSVPTLNRVKHRDRCTDDVNPLFGQETAQAGVSHCRSPSVFNWVAEIVRDRSAQPIPIKQGSRKALRTQPTPEQIRNCAFAGTGEPGDPKHPTCRLSGFLRAGKILRNSQHAPHLREDTLL